MEPKIVDFGCGLNPHPKANILVDINPIIRELEKGEKIIHDLNKLPYPFDDETIDEIYSHECLEHLTGLHIFGFISECYRILKPKGVLYLELPNPFFYKSRINYLLGNYVVDANFHPYHVKFMLPTDLLKQCRYIGFGVKFELVSRFWRKIGFEKMWPNLFSKSIKVKATKRQ